MSEHMLLACILSGALIFLLMCFGCVLIMIAVDVIKNNGKEDTEDDPFDETEIAE